MKDVDGRRRSIDFKRRDDLWTSFPTCEEWALRSPTHPKMDGHAGPAVDALARALASKRFHGSHGFDATGRRFVVYGYDAVDCLGARCKSAWASGSSDDPLYDVGLVDFDWIERDCSCADASEDAIFFVHPLAPLFSETGADFARTYRGLEKGDSIVVPFYALRDAGFDVHLVPTVRPGRCNVLHYCDRWTPDLFKLKKATSRCVLAAPGRAARAKVETAGGETLDELPHFPRPSRLPRSDARGDDVSAVLLVGAAFDDDFCRCLESMGVDVSRDDASYERVDLVLAILDDVQDAVVLVDAWRAGVPALLGDARVYSDLRDSPLDYFEVDDADDCLEAVDVLMRDKALYAAMRKRARDRAADYTAAVCAAKWAHYLDCQRR